MINDLDLMVLFMFLRDAGGVAGGGATDRLLGEWEHSLRHYGPGLIDLALEQMTDAEAQEVAAAIREVRERVGTFGERVPESVLRARNITPGVVFADFPVRLLVEAAVRLENLISPGRCEKTG